MKTLIGIYENHELAMDAVREMKEEGYPVEKLSIIGRSETEEIDEKLNTVPKDPIKPASLGAGAAIGATVGVLTGIGVFAIPGLGFLFGAGALVGAIAGLDFGIIGGGIATVLTTIGVKDDPGKEYEKYLNEGKFLVIAQGTEEEIAKGNEILNAHGTHSAIATH